MAIKMCEVSVGDATWSFNTLPATKGWPAFTKFCRIVAEPMARLSGAADLSDDDQVPAEIFAGAVRAFTERLSEPESLELVKVLLQDLRKDGKTIQFDNEFAANYGVLLRLFAYAAKENFQSFLDGKDALSELGSLLK